MKEQELLRQMANLPKEIAPDHDVWPRVLSRIEGTGRVAPGSSPMRPWRPVAIAAGVLVAFAVGLLLGPKWLATPTGGVEMPQLAEQEQVPDQYTPSLSALLAATELEYQAAFSELVPLDYSGIRLQGEEPDALRGSWEALLQAETSLLAALEQYPSNVYLNGKLLDLRSQQLQFVKQLALLEQNNWRRT